MVSPRLVKVGGKAMWIDSPYVAAMLEGQVGMYGNHSWQISYRGFNGSFSRVADKKDYRYRDGYSLWLDFGNKEKKYRGGVKRMQISPFYIKLYAFKTKPQVKKAFKKFIDNLLSAKIKCNDCDTPLNFNTIDSCINCFVDWQPQFFCKKHLYQNTKIDDSYYSCERHNKSEWNGWDEATMRDEDLHPKEQTNAYEVMLKKRMGWEAESINNTIFDKYKDKWEWNWVSRNPNLTLAFIERNIDKLNWKGLSRNSALTPAFIDKYKDELNWNFLVLNASLTPAFIEENIDKLGWKGLSDNPSLTPAFIDKYIDKLYMGVLSQNPSLTPTLIEKYEDKLDWYWLSGNPSLTMALIEKYEDKLNWEHLSKNPNLTPAFIEENIDNLSDFKAFPKNPALTPALIEKYKDKWAWDWVSRNPNLTIAFIERNIDKLNWRGLSRNPNLTPAFIDKYKDKLDWKWLSKNPAIFKPILNPYELMIKKRLGMAAESTWDDKPTVEADNGGEPREWNGTKKLHWSSYYRGYEIAISKVTPKNNYGYDVWIQWKGSKMGYRKTRKQMRIPAQYLELHIFKTMPQVKKAIKQFIDGVESGNTKCQSCAKSMTWENIEMCHGCYSNSYNSFSKASPGIYCQSCQYTSTKRPPLYEGGSNPSACKEHTLNAIYKIETGNYLQIEVPRRNGQTREERNLEKIVELEKVGITEDDLTPLTNRYEIMLKRRLKMGAEEKRLNPLLIGAGILVLLSYLKS